MTQLNNKRKADDEHKDIVISNVEFCMMQFYKNQTEAWQARNTRQQRKMRKLEQDLHVSNVHNASLLSQNLQQASYIGDLQDDVNHQQETIHTYQHLLAARSQAHAKAESELYACHELFCELLRDHPELEDFWQDRLAQAVPLNSAESISDTDSEATQPTFDHIDV